jgi:predicted PurR-regulated permease PerM
MFGGMYRALARRMKPGAAAGAVIVATLLLVMLPALALLGVLAGRAPAIAEQIMGGETFNRLSQVQIGNLQLGSVLNDLVVHIREALPAAVLGMLAGMVLTILNLVIALFGQYYLHIGGARVWENVRAFLPLSSTNAESLRVRFRSLTEAMLIGILLTAIVQGAIVGFGFWLVGLGEPVFWGGVTAIVSVLPLFGSGLVWFPGMIVLLADGRLWAASILLVLGAVIASNIDNVIRIIVNKRVADIHPMVTILGAFGGIAIFGLVGVLVGPLILSYFFELARVYRAEFGPETPDGTT